MVVVVVVTTRIMKKDDDNDEHRSAQNGYSSVTHHVVLGAECVRLIIGGPYGARGVAVGAYPPEQSVLPCLELSKFLPRTYWLFADKYAFIETMIFPRQKTSTHTETNIYIYIYYIHIYLYTYTNIANIHQIASIYDIHT